MRGDDLAFRREEGEPPTAAGDVRQRAVPRYDSGEVAAVGRLSHDPHPIDRAVRSDRGQPGRVLADREQPFARRIRGERHGSRPVLDPVVDPRSGRPGWRVRAKCGAESLPMARKEIVGNRLSREQPLVGIEPEQLSGLEKVSVIAHPDGRRAPRGSDISAFTPVEDLAVQIDRQRLARRRDDHAVGFDDQPRERVSLDAVTPELSHVPLPPRCRPSLTELALQGNAGSVGCRVRRPLAPP